MSLSDVQIRKNIEDTVKQISGVGGENRRTREAEKVIMLEAAFDGSMHIAKLTAVALVEDHHDMLIVDRMFGCTADER